MFSSKCAEVFCQSYENFSIVCTDCNLKTNDFNDFVLHYQEIHCSLQPTIKVEAVLEDAFPETDKAEDDAYTTQNLIDPMEVASTANILNNEFDIKNEIVRFLPDTKDEQELDESAFSETDDDIPLQDILKANPLESSGATCSQCGKEYANRASLRMHIRRFHPESKLPRLNASNATIKCPDCPNKTYSSAKALYRHRAKKHKKTAELIDKTSTAEDNLVSIENAVAADLEQAHKNVDSTRVDCIKTEKNTSNDDAEQTTESEDSDNEPTLQSSRKNVQADRKQYECPACKKIYYHRKSLQRHIHRQHPDVKLPRLNAAPATTTCPDCPGKTYKTRKALQRHRREHHTQPPIDNYQCPHCEKQFKSRERVTAHMRCVHKISKKPIDLKRYPCTQCERTFSEKYMLKRHELRHTGIRNVICTFPDCGLAFYDVKAMGAHRRLTHGARKYVCDICGYSAKTMSTLQTHIRTHTGEKPYKCDQCDKCFTTSAAVIEHKVIHNTHIRPYVCDVCGKSFARPKALYHHKPLHLGIKKFICKVCGKAYAQQAGLSAHKRQHNIDAMGTPI